MGTPLSTPRRRADTDYFTVSVVNQGNPDGAGYVTDVELVLLP